MYEVKGFAKQYWTVVNTANVMFKALIPWTRSKAIADKLCKIMNEEPEEREDLGVLHRNVTSGEVVTDEMFIG
jgi:hypothetical protein